MNIAVIKHTPDNDFCHKYLFSVPEGVKLKAGDAVMCKTEYGEAYGWLVYDSFEVEGPALQVLLNTFGAKELSPIVGVYELSEFEDGSVTDGGSVQELKIDESMKNKEITIIANAQITDILTPEMIEKYRIDGVVNKSLFAETIKKEMNYDDVVVTDLKFFIRDGE